MEPYELLSYCYWAIHKHKWRFFDAYSLSIHGNELIELIFDLNKY